MMQNNVVDLPYVLVRSITCVYAGYLLGDEPIQTIVITNDDVPVPALTLVMARRIRVWTGAASLSELAMVGSTLPEQCKFLAPVIRKQMTDVTEILNVTEQAKSSIESVAVIADFDAAE